MKLNFKDIIWVLLLSFAVFFGIVWFIYFKPVAHTELTWVLGLPLFNAWMNFLSAFCLCLGIWFISRAQKKAHQTCMLMALGFSALFLIGYLVYHHFHGDTLFTGVGWIRNFYFFVLISHIILTFFALPLILWTVLKAFLGEFDAHKRVARWTFPVWLYVSVSGILVYWMLR